jgi:hypothetical protein
MASSRKSARHTAKAKPKAAARSRTRQPNKPTRSSTNKSSKKKSAKPKRSVRAPTVRAPTVKKPRRTTPQRSAPAREQDALPDSPAPFPKTGREVPVVVARSLLNQGRVQVASQPVPRIQLRLGDLLLVRHAYELQESSPDKETYTFDLDARLGEHVQPRVTERIADRMGVEDDAAGFIQQRFRPRSRGTYELEFTAAAEYEVKPWGSGRLLTKERRAASGRITVVVS